MFWQPKPLLLFSIFRFDVRLQIIIATRSDGHDAIAIHGRWDGSPQQTVRADLIDRLETSARRHSQRGAIFHIDQQRRLSRFANNAARSASIGLRIVTTPSVIAPGESRD